MNRGREISALASVVTFPGTAAWWRRPETAAAKMWSMALLAACVGGLSGQSARADTLVPGHVINISTRGRVGVGDEVLIGGFVIVGESPRKVLVRVLGPSLTQFGVHGALADPIVRIIPPGGSTPLAENDNWGSGDQAAVIATGYAPFHALDCALVLDLPPGLYTAIVSGVGGGTGVALVEVFDLDQPIVEAATPAKNLVSVAPGTSSATVTFDRAMTPVVDMEPCAAWGASNYVWSADHTQLTISRISAATPIAAGTRVTITLNPASGGHQMCDCEGNTLPSYTLAFTVGSSAGTPYVVSTVPENGATVSADLRELVFTFSEPMEHVEGGTTNGWWPYVCTWSDDKKTEYVTRTGTATLPVGATISFGVLPPYYKSVAGVPMESSYTLTFAVGLDRERVEADPAHGFSWPYYLVVPPSVTAPATLLVEPNNTGTWGDNPTLHENSAANLARNKAGFAATLGTPLLVPVFPRPVNPPSPEPGGIYVHALDRYTLATTTGPLARIDLQLLAMVEHARAKLATRGINADAKFFMTGFSASGAFTSRFAMLHPDRLKAAACGSPGGWPIAPVSSWNGVSLRYPCGVADLTSFTGGSPDIALFKQLPLFIYVGSIDTNDAFDVRGMTTAEQSAIKSLFHSPQDAYIANRWPLAEEIYESIGSIAEFVVYTGVGHSINSEMMSDLQEFFSGHR